MSFVSLSDWDSTVGKRLSVGSLSELVSWLIDWSTSGLLLGGRGSVMALITFGFSGGGFLIALTTYGFSGTLESTIFGFSCTLESPVTRGVSFHFILATRSIMAALICGSILSLSELVCGTGLFGLRF